MRTLSNSTSVWSPPGSDCLADGRLAMHIFTYGTLMIPSHKYYFTEDCFAGDVEKPDLGGQAHMMRNDYLLQHRILFGGKGWAKEIDVHGGAR